MTPAQFWQIEQQNQQNRQEFMQGQQENLMSAIGQFAGQFAENKALDAKGAAYGDFLKRHGQQLGFDPTWLEETLKRPNRDLAMIGDNIVGISNAGRSLMSQQIVGMQMAPRSTAGYGTGAAASAAPRESFTF